MIFRVRRALGRLACRLFGHVPERIPGTAVLPYRVTARVVRCPRCRRVLDVEVQE